MSTVIEVEHLHKKYGAFNAVEDVSFSVTRGEIFGLLGPNGAGKTTTVECLQGLRRADEGKLRVLGLNPMTESAILRHRVGCQLQESALPDRIHVWEALSLFASLNAGSADWKPLMTDWGLEDKARASFVSLSGGQRQRLFVALALINNPEVVFLDEMTTGLDPAARRVAWELIRKIREHGSTVVLVTHSMDEASELCDRIAIIDKGKLSALDTPNGLIEAYASEFRVVFSCHEPDISWLLSVECVTRVERSGPLVMVFGHGAVLARVASALVQHGLAPEDLRIERPSLENVFLKITGHGSHE
jgi:ABC-2 type transport system ATP-binding protein